MGYCRFEIAYRELRDCFDSWEEEDINDVEKKYRNKLLMLCENIVDSYAGTEE